VLITSNTLITLIILMTLIMQRVPITSIMNPTLMMTIMLNTRITILTLIKGILSIGDKWGRERQRKRWVARYGDGDLAG